VITWRVPVAILAAPTLGETGETKRQQALYLAGVARGDVARIVFGDQTLYTRGRTWGEFGGAWLDPAGHGPLLVYGHSRLLESITLALKPEQLRIH
jgi:hypothetical protein